MKHILKKKRLKEQDLITIKRGEILDDKSKPEQQSEPKPK